MGGDYRSNGSTCRPLETLARVAKIRTSSSEGFVGDLCASSSSFVVVVGRESMGQRGEAGSTKGRNIKDARNQRRLSTTVKLHDRRIIDLHLDVDNEHVPSQPRNQL